MKKCLFFIALLLASPLGAVKQATLLLNLTTGKTLYAHRDTAPHPPASLTKVMTLFLVFDEIAQGRLDWNTPITIPSAAVRVERVRIGYRAGEKIPLRDIVYALIVCSANDAAASIAHHIAGSETAFARRMNYKAQSLGMHQTHFMNASGLPNKHQISSARDLSVLCRALMSAHPQYYFLFSTPTYKFRGRHFRSTNKFLDGKNGVDGIKTGYVHASLFNIIVSRVVKGERFLAVVLGEPSKDHRNRKVAQLLGLPKPGATPVIGSSQKGSWSIQTGAFKTRTLAEKHAVSLQAQYGGEISALASYRIKPSKNMFKPLFGTFPKAELAIQACHLLKQKGQDCFVVGVEKKVLKKKRNKKRSKRRR